MRVLSILFCMSLTLGLAAQQPLPRIQKMSFGDTELHVRFVFQDKLGFIWLGAGEGLFRYDGSTLEHYLLPIKDSIEQVSAFYEDPNQTIWIGTAKGNIFKLKGNTIEPLTVEEGLPKVPITAFVSDAQNRLWFATYGEGMYCLKQGRLYNVNTDDGLNDNYLYALMVDPSGTVVSASDAGINLVKYTNNKKIITVISQKDGLPDNIITSLRAYNKDHILAGTQSKGVIKINLKTRKITPFTLSNNWDYGAVVSIANAAGYWYYATSEKGLIQANQSGQILGILNRENSTVSNKLSSMLTDLEGNVWITDQSSKLITFNPIFSFIPLSKPQASNLYAVYKDSKGIVWMGDNKNIRAYDNGVFLNLPTPVAHIPAIAIYEDSKGYIWFGTFDSGVFRYHSSSKKLNHYTEKNGLVNNNVLSITGNENEIWFATLGGVSRYSIQNNVDDVTFTSFNRQNGFDANYVYQAYCDSKNKIWFATEGYGVISYEKNKGFVRHTGSTGEPLKVVHGITEDHTHRLWINAAQEGIFRLEGNHFHRYSLYGNSNPGSHLITSLFADKLNNLLLVKANGIDMLHLPSGMLLHHSDELGLDNIEPNLNAGCIDKDGSIWMGMQHGIIKYTPSGNLWRGPTPVIKKVSLFLNELDKTTARTFSHDENYLSFDYVGLWYHDPEEVIYQIKLDGYDETWIRTKNKTVTYPRLPPGEYTFRLKVSADASLMNTREVSYSFRIQKPFWGQWWFMVASAFTGIVLIWGLIKQREKKLQQKQSLERDAIAFQFETLKSQINPHFLFNSFNTLAGLIEKDRTKAVSYVEQLSDFYRSILTYRDKDVIPLSEELNLLQNYFFLQQKRYGDKLSLNIDESLITKQYYIAPLTLQLLMENAVKHNIISRDKHLTVSVQKSGAYLVVSNNFQPKQSTERSTGMGLQNIRSRYKILSKLDISIENTSQTFSVYIPLIELP